MRMGKRPKVFDLIIKVFQRFPFSGVKHLTQRLFSFSKIYAQSAPPTYFIFVFEDEAEAKSFLIEILIIRVFQRFPFSWVKYLTQLLKSNEW